MGAHPMADVHGVSSTSFADFVSTLKVEHAASGRIERLWINDREMVFDPAMLRVSVSTETGATLTGELHFMRVEFVKSQPVGGSS